MSLDIALRNTGVCVFRAEDELVYWTTVSPPAGLTHPVKRIAYNAGVIGTIAAVFDVKEVAFEDYAYAAGGKGGTNLHENTGAIKQEMNNLNIRLFPYGIQVVRKWAVGHGDLSRDSISIAFAKQARKRKDVTEHVQDAFFIGLYHFHCVREALLRGDTL